MLPLKPLVRVLGAEYHLFTTDMVAIPRSLLGERVANIESQRDVIVDAVDFLMQGF